MAETVALTQRRTANPYLERLEVEVGLVDDRFGRGWSRGFRTSNFDQWQPDRTLALRDWRFSFCYRYSWAIPNAEAITVVAGLRRIVEMGAGTGYWASLVAGAGADVVAYDQSPPTGSNPTEDGDDRTAIAAKARDAGAEWHGNERGWFPVRKGEPTDLRRHRDRALLLVLHEHWRLAVCERHADDVDGHPEAWRLVAARGDVLRIARTGEAAPGGWVSDEEREAGA